MAPVGHPTTQAHMGVTAEVLGAALHTKANKVGLESKWPGGGGALESQNLTGAGPL